MNQSQLELKLIVFEREREHEQVHGSSLYCYLMRGKVDFQRGEKKVHAFKEQKQSFIYK
jgi:hypothetical protein